MKSVGLAMIVRDIADTLPVTLKSVEGLFDQVVVIDTGSVDNTIEIARSFGADVHHFDWIHDFSAARNYSFDQLKTDWAFWLDGDDLLIGREYFAEMCEKVDAQNLEGCLLEYVYSLDSIGQAELARLEPQILSRQISSDEVYARLSPRCNTTQYRERLVRNDPTWRWVYPVHEALPAVGRRFGKYDKVRVIHRRHVRKISAHSGRNLEILNKVPLEKRDERIWFYFGLEYASSGRTDEAIDAFEKYVPMSTVEDEKYLVHCFLGDLRRAKSEWDQSISNYLRAVELRPTWRDAYAGLLQSYVQKGDMKAALYYGAMCERAEIPNTPFAYNPVHERVGWVGDYAKVLLAHGRVSDALQVTQQALTVIPEDQNLQYNLDVIGARSNFETGQTAVAHAIEFFLRQDQAETAALLISRLPPEVANHEDIRSWVDITAHICGAASRGEILADALHNGPVFDESDSEGWHDVRMQHLKQILAARPEIKRVLQVGGPELVGGAYIELGISAFRTTHVGNWQGGPFDAIVLWNCLERVAAPEGLIEQARTVLSPGGYLLAYVPNGPSTRGLQPPSKEHVRLRAFTGDQFRQVMGTVRFPDILPAGPAYSGDMFLQVPTSLTVRPKQVAIVCPLAPEAWGPWSLNTGIGGSEEAVVRLSRAFARRGHHVTVYGSGWGGKEEVLDDHAVLGVVDYKQIREYEPADVLLGWRYPEIFLNQMRPLEAEWRGLWLHDSIEKQRVASASGFVDVIWCISSYHASLYDGIPKIYVGRNGIDPFEFEQIEQNNPELKKNPAKVVYLSTPFRGLHVLLEQYWPEIKRRVPEAELHCYYGWDAADRMGVTSTPDGKAFKENVMRLVQQPGVVWRGRVGQPELYKELLTSGVWAYPSSWAEEHCCHSDTMISVPGDHRGGPPRVRIVDLVGKSDFPVWTYDENEHRFKIGTALRVWQTKIADELVECVLDDGSRLRLTPEHHVFLRDEEWICAGDLQPGHRLMALHHRYHVMIKDANGDWVPEHRLVGEWMAKRSLGPKDVVDHHDPLRLDNRPEALQVMSFSEHSSKTWKSIEYTKKGLLRRSDAHRRFWVEHPEWREKKIASLRTKGKELWERINALPADERAEWLRHRGEARRKTYELMRREDPERYAEMAKKWARNGLATIHKAREVRCGSQNHRVISIRRIPGGPVFDMEVEGTHNFVADGVVVHNCISAYLAQAAGVWPVVFPRGALDQSVVFGWKVDGPQFIDAVCAAIRSDGNRQKMADWMRKWTSWDDVASLWERLFLGRAA